MKGLAFAPPMMACRNGQPMELLRERAQALRHELEGRDRNGDLTAARAHHRAASSDPVAHIQALDLIEGRLAQCIDAAEELDGARMIHELEEGHLALNATRHHAPSKSHLIVGVLSVLQMGVALIQLSHRMRAGECMPIRIASYIDQRLTLRATHFDGIVFDDLRCFFRHALLFLWEVID